MMSRSLRFLGCLCVALSLALASGTRLSAAEQTYVIDTPTTGMLDYGVYDLNFRLFSDGGILTRLNFGVFKIVNLGFGWEVNRVIGSENIVVGPPALYLKIRPYAGGMTLPALAFGYDGQGYFYDKDKNEFRDREKGIFAVFGREILFPGLEINAGANINDFKTNTVYGFVSIHFNLEDKFILMGEYDRINYLPDARLNLGARFSVAEDLSIDLAGRDIGAAGRSAERILRVVYIGKF
ncbi:MAG: hypothetical protein ACYC5N_00730 [Endomicrobiales bacterium]